MKSMLFVIICGMLTVPENVLKKAVDQSKSYQDAMFDVAKTTIFLKRVCQGEIPTIG